MTRQAVVPRPDSMESTGGWFEFTSPLVIVIDSDPAARDCAQLLVEYLQVTGSDVRLGTERAQIALRLDGAGRAVADPLDVDESYRLDVTTDGIVITAPHVAGLRHGVQTLRQLLPPEIYAAHTATGVTWRVPCVRISDAPRLRWRGSLLDVGRYFLPLDYLHRYVETLAVHKLNRFHLHLTEDQGWRMQVQRYPRLTEIGAWRAESEVGARGEERFDGTPHGGFYTQDELRALVAFAARRGVEVVPEIDMPGHMTAAIAAHPELGNTGVQLEVATRWGVHPTVLNLDESTFGVLTNVLTEVMDVFPAPWVHIGGDECPTQEWAASPAARSRMRELGLSSVGQLQEWFTARICAFLREHDRTPVVWDEAATADLDRDVIVMAWRDADLGFAAAERGHRVVMTPQQSTYFDWYQSDEPGQPVAQPGLTTLRTAYEHWTEPAGLSAAALARIIGTQGQLWTEYLPTPQRVDEMAYPRLCALAERAWSTPSAQSPDYDDFAARLSTHLERLRAGGTHVSGPRRG